MKIPSIALVLLGSLACMADEIPGRAPVEPKSLPAPDQPVAPAQPSVTKLEDGRMKVGEVTFDPETRAVEFPARINMTEGLLEFLVVHQNGKVHESLFVTDISATDLNIALKLLRYKASRELYLKLNKDGSLSSVFEEASDEEKRESRLSIFVREGEGEDAKETNVCDWIHHAVTEKPMPREPWVYGGSFFYEGKFVAETSGDIIAIFLSNAALGNYAGKDNQDDNVWLVRPRVVPAEGTSVKLVIRPYQP